jgi:hypothetical protein
VFSVREKAAGRVLAVVTIGRDRASLEAEAAFERGGAGALEESLAPEKRE